MPCDNISGYFASQMCRLCYAKGTLHNYLHLRNDELAFSSNLFIKRCVLPKMEKSECQKLGNELLFVLPGNLDNVFPISNREIVDNIKQRIRKSQRVLLELGNRENSNSFLSLIKYKVFYFNKGKWRKIKKGKNVRKSPFGLWVTKKHMEISLFVFSFAETMMVWNEGNVS